MSRATLQGGGEVIAFMCSADAFGVSENGCCVDTAEILTAVRAHRLPARRLERVLQQDAELSFHVLVKGAHEVRAAQLHVLCLGQHDAVRRLARVLLDCRSEAACFDDATAMLVLPVSRTDIADYLGTCSSRLRPVAPAWTSRAESLGPIDCRCGRPHCGRTLSGWARHRSECRRIVARGPREQSRGLASCFDIAVANEA